MRSVFDDLIDGVREGVWAVDAAGITVFTSARMAEMMAAAPQDLAGHPFSASVAEPDPGAGPAPPTREGRALLLRRRDGSRFWASVATIPLSGGNPGVPGATLHLISDLTRRLDAERRLSESEARFRALFESNPQPMWIYDLETLAFLEVNDAAVAHYGYSREEFHSMTLRDIRPREDITALERNVAAVSSGLDLAGIWRHRRKDGAIILVEIISHTIDYGGRPSECVVAHDVTKRHRAEEALRKSESTMRAVLEAVPDEMLLVRRDGAVLDVHARRGGVLWPAGNAPGLDLADVLPATLAVATCSRLGRTLDEGTAQTWEQELGSGAEGRWVELRLAPRGRDDVLVVVRDVTERRRLDERIRQAQKLEGLEVLAGGIAHDFNNLLASVMGHAGLALAHLPAASPLRPFVQNIETAAQRGAELTRQMLAYSGRGRLVIERIHLAGVIEEMVHLLRAVVTRSAVFELDLPDDLPWIEGDSTQIRQVLMNLLTNASDAIGRKPGSISIRAGVQRVGPGQRPDDLAEGALADGEYVTFEVADTGCGMDARTRERLFDPFFTTKFAGRGLGLAAVRGIVRAHRGAIRVESEPGAGSKFTVLLPSAGACMGQAQEAAALAVRSAEREAGSGLILLVDDEAEIRAMARTVLEEAGYAVIEAADGIEALERYRERAEEIRLVLLDLTMPKRDGDEAFRDILALRPDARVILTSGGVESDLDARLDRTRLAGILPKPYLTGQLVEAVRAALSASPA